MLTSKFMISISREPQGVRGHERFETQRAAGDVVELIKTHQGLGRVRRYGEQKHRHTHTR